ncbi:hypothetical protein [Paenibacillus cineris]|uniref:Uncharacterized protein n=1 Tax=Paenibacillus cineris TaxID=237530 RepID=A0ABQ4L654_9BACL|nr:hypothetical protein [Paenibacillus cineris]GIO52079.1 hypothetical protein J21TS7_03970 [Paenibacillus cineris]
MSTERKRTVMIIAVIIVILVGYRIYALNYTDEGIMDHVFRHKGYAVDLVKEQVPVKIFVKPEWIAFGQDERKDLKVEVLDLNHTRILLDNVWNRGNDIYFSFEAFPGWEHRSGEFMYNGKLNPDGSVSLQGPHLRLTDMNGHEIPVGQCGEGPRISFSFGINPEDYHLIRDGFYVEYSDFNVYRYAKKINEEWLGFNSIFQ